jgi:hypothetical protein
MTVTFQALSSSLNVSAKPRQGRAILRRFLDALIEGRQRKAAVKVAEYLERHPEYRELNSHRQASDMVERRLSGR